MSKHTPKPWRNDGREIEPSRGHRVEYVEATNGDGFVAQVWTPSDGDASKRIANARLIAAAPDLLAACEAMVAACELTDEAYYDTIDAATEQARAAIAKAKGE
jgi:hypothetical protein